MGTRKRRTSDGTGRTELTRVLHDLRQPLTALRLDLGGALQLLSRNPPPIAETLAALRDAVADTEELQRMLDELQGRSPAVTAPTPVERLEPPAP